MEKINVNVYGDNYPLRVENSELTGKAAGEVDGVMRRFAAKAPDLEPKKLAVLAAIQFAEKKNELEEELSQLRHKMARVNEFIEQNLH
ncbi:MAG: cell division protein ZapA [Chlorobiaceae bacterium]|nr:cell division protein ZapA [Chlorobiaceae bacterium]